MKRLFYIILFCLSANILRAQDTIVVDSMLLTEDTTISIRQDTILPYTLDDLDLRLLEYTLSWLDTTSCTTVIADTTALSDSIYISRLMSLPYIIEMPYNQVVRSFIDMYVVRRQKQVARLRTLSGLYFPLFEEKLYQYGLPEELKYLPVIESGLNPTAYSRAGAAGLWQFMPHTAKNFGLEVNSLIDERLDPIKATDAACRFLSSLYKIYEDWNLVIAAYNCGPGNVNKAIRRAGDKRDFWDIWPYLPRETRSYLPIFIAANYALNFADEHDICMANLPQVLATDTICIDHRLHLLQVSELIGIEIQELRRLNPQYRMDVLPGTKQYTLCLPIEMTGAFLQYEDTIYKYKADTLINNRRAVIDLAQKTDADGFPAMGAYTYIVKRGDTLGAIAKRQKTTVAKIKKWNNLSSDNIRVGQKLKMYR